MKEKVLLIFFLCNVALFVSAQSHMEKGLQSISRSSTEAIINFLAGDELQGRESGFHGSRPCNSSPAKKLIIASVEERLILCNPFSM